MAGQLNRFNAFESYAKGAEFGEQMRENQRVKKARNALGRIYSGDETALKELMELDPEAGRQVETQIGMRQFVSPATQEQAGPVRPGIDASLEAQPAKVDVEGLTGYLASRGDSGALKALTEKMAPKSPEWLGTNVTDAEGNVWGVSKEGGWQQLPGVKAKPEGPEIKGGWILGPDGMPQKPLPMTPQEQAAADRAAEAARLREQQIEVQLAGLQQGQQDKAQQKQQEVAKKYKAVDDLDATLAAYKTAMQSASRADLANPMSDKSIELNSLATQLQMAYKNAADLGAITGPDWAIINRIIQTPSGATAAIKGPEALLQQLEQVSALSKRERASLDSIYKQQQPTTGQPTQPPAETLTPYQQYVREFNAAKAKGDRAKMKWLTDQAVARGYARAR